jgi:hypothetical protein
MNKGQIRSAGLRVVSDTILRLHDAARLRRMRVFGKLALSLMTVV